MIAEVTEGIFEQEVIKAPLASGGGFLGTLM